MNAHSSQEITNPDPRFAAGRDWAREQLAGRRLDFSVASADASFRRYFRIEEADSRRSWILMDAPPEREDCRPFIDIAGRLRAAGLNAPEVLAGDLRRGYLLLTDLGRQTFLQAMTPASADKYMNTALDALVAMQAGVSRAGLPQYDDALLRRELELYPDWYLGHHRGVRFDDSERETWEDACRRLIDAARAQPQVFVHRDYMPRNLMVSPGGTGVIDFQDAVQGPVTYDVVSLFRDAFASWPETQVARWLQGYRERAQRHGIGLPDDLERAFDWMGLQRHLKVIGIFARLHYRDGKPKYLAEIPRFFRYVYDIGGRYAEFAPLLELMRRHEAAA